MMAQTAGGESMMPFISCEQRHENCYVLTATSGIEVLRLRTQRLVKFHLSVNGGFPHLAPIFMRLSLVFTRAAELGGIQYRDSASVGG